MGDRRMGARNRKELPESVFAAVAHPVPPKGVLQRAISILRCFTEERPELSLAEISEQTGLHKSTVYRLLNTLEKERFVRQSLDRRSYQLGVGLLELTKGMFGPSELRKRSKLFMWELQRQTGETVGLHVRLGHHRVCVDEIESDHPLRMCSRVGYPYPLYAGAAGKVLLAFAPESEREYLIRSQPLVKICRNTITDPLRLREELRQVAAQGFAVSVEETTSGAAAVAAPVYDASGRVVASLNITGPLSRLAASDWGELARLVREVARHISEAMGYREFRIETGAP